MLALSFLPFILIVVHTKSISVESISPSFYVIPIGTSGGLQEDNLSAYLLTSVNDNTPNSAYISLDSGTIRYGLE
jgi:3',5'-cyclic-nucleotide phosphodiesterase